MVSHRKIGGLEISIGAGGLRFKKRPSQFNIKVGKCMKEKGVKPTEGGRYDKKFQKEFIKCVEEAGGDLRASTKKKWGL